MRAYWKAREDEKTQLPGRGARSAAARPRPNRHPRPPGAGHQRRHRNRHRARRSAPLGGQDHDGSRRPLRLRLRHFHATRRGGEHRRREVPAPVPDRQARRPHRRHLAVLLRQFLLAQRSRAEQRHQRRRSGAVGYQGTPGRHACLPASGRQVPRGRHLLHACRRRRDPTNHRPGPQVHGSGIPLRARAGGRARHGGLWRGAWRGRHHRSP